MPFLTDEDVGLGSSYLSDEDVGLGAPEEMLGEPGGERATESEIQDWTPKPESPGFFKSLARGSKASLESMQGGAGLLGAASVGGQGQDQYLKDLLESEFEKSQDVAPPTKMGQAGELIGNLGGSLLQYAATSVATGGTPVGPMISFGAGGAYNSFVKSGLRAMSEGRSVDDALVIAKGASGIGAAKEAALAAIPGGRVVRQIVAGGVTEGGGQIVENLAERGLGLQTPVMEGVGQAALTGAFVPAAGHAVGKAIEAGTTRFTPPERGGIPEPVRTTGEPNVIQEPGRKTQPAIEDTQIRAAEPQGEVQGRGEELPAVPTAQARQQLDTPAAPTGPEAVLQEPGRKTQPASETPQDAGLGARTEAQAQAKPQEGNAPQDQGVPLDKSKWTKATDTANLKAATTEQRTEAAQRPLDVDSFLKQDADGHRAVDTAKLRTAVEGGHITSASPATDALLLHMLKESDAHPLKSIRMLDLTPEQAQFLTGESTAFHGRFSQKAGERTGLVEMVMKRQGGEPVTAAQFMETLTHELGHNTVTSKFREAPPEIQKDIDSLFSFVQKRGKGTEWEKHNALRSAHELWAELADPKVYEWLSGLDYTADIRKVDIGIAQVPAITPISIRNSALGRFYEIAKKLLKLPDFITDAFGNKVETITALDQMVSLSSRLEKIKRSGRDAGANLSEARPTGDFRDAISESDKMTNEEIQKRGLSPTKLMWELGSKAKTAEDVAALKTMAEESTAKVKALAKEGKIEEAMAIAGRQPAEAYEYATGVKLDGTVKWTTMEKMEPGYVPPVPDAKYLEAKGGDGFSISNIDELAGKLREAGSAESPAMGREFKQRFDEAISRSGDSEIPVERLVKGINSARITVNKENGSLTIHTEGYGAGDKISHETVTVTATEDGSLRMFASGGKTQRLLKFSIEQAADLFKPKTPTVKESLIVEPPKAQPPPPDKPTTTAAPAAEPDGSKMETSQKWIGATEETKPETGLGGQMSSGIPNPVAVYRGIQKAVKDYGPSVKAAGKAVSDAVRDIYKENLNIRKMGDLDRSVLGWSAKLQRSFGEASSAQKDIQAAVKDPVRDAALTNWLEAGGDKAKLTAWRDGTADPKLRAGYEAALNLTPEEMKIAQDARVAYDVLGDRGTTYEVLRNFRDDYVTHIWDLGKGSFAGGARTLKDQFKFAKARTFENYFQGEQAGFKPKTKRLSQLLPVYIHEMNSVIAAKQLVKQMWGGKAKDGSPLLATRGQAVPVSGAKGEAVLVRPEAPSPDSAKKGLDISKYKELPGHPALHDWVFAGKDTAGNPIFEKSDLVLHPEAYKKLKAILGKSKIREWYESQGTGPLATTMKIPKAIAKGLDLYQQETKRTMFGLFAPFHQVQEAWHGVGHRILPTPVTGGQSTKAGALKLPRPDLDNPEIYDMAKNGLMILPDRASEAHFMDGMRHSGLVSHIPWVGKAADGYSKYLFHEVIPGLKIKTYAAALERNKGVYKKDLASGEVNLEDVKLLTATQVNAAYGHLNYADFGRDPTIQHILQLGLLAPDFLEARMRFFGQGLKGLVPELGAKGERISGARGNKVGREQLYALATLAAAQALLAYTGAKLTDGEWDGKHPFEFRKGNRKYTLRSVPEDMQRFWEDIRNVFRGGGEIPFISHRLNPVTGRGPLQLLTGRDWRQQKITPQETVKQLALAPIPLTARSFMGIDKSPLEDWEQLAGAAGAKIMNYSPQSEVYKMLLDWKKKSEDPRLVAQAEQAEAQTFAPSDYSDLRQAMERDNFQLGAKAYEKLLETHTAKEVRRAMNPESVDPDTGASRDKMLPKALEKQFLASLKDEEREVYEAAKRQRRVMYQRFQKMLAE